MDQRPELLSLIARSGSPGVVIQPTPVRWWEFYPSKAEALDAVGMSEQDAHTSS